MARLGFIGLGTMGGPMVQRLLDAGHQVTGYNRTRSRAQWLVDLGMDWADSPREASQSAEVTFTMVRDTEALQAVALGPDGLLAGLGPGKIYVDMSTVSPASIQKLAQQVAEKGAKGFSAAC